MIFFFTGKGLSNEVIYEIYILMYDIKKVGLFIEFQFSWCCNKKKNIV